MAASVTQAVPVAPGIFSYTLDGGRTFFPAAEFADGTFLADPTIFPGARRAKAGDTAVIFANSLAVSPSGVVSVSGGTHPVTVTIGPATVTAVFSGLIAPGEYQINFTVPAGLGAGSLPFYFIVGGASSDVETIATQ